MPTVSVVLSVYNGEKTLSKCLQSVLDQTYQDFEIILVNDNSTDNTRYIIQQYKDNNKIITVHNNKNLGLTKSLNIGIQRAQGIFMARIDADDWWDKHKLHRQVIYLENHPNIGIVGTNCVSINTKTKKRFKIKKPETNSQIRNTLYKESPFVHSSVLVRAQLLKEHGLYDEEYRFAQDYELWNRLLLYTKGYNIQDDLCFRLVYNDSISYNKWKEQQVCIIKIMRRYYPIYKYSLLNYFHILKRISLLLLPHKAKSVIQMFR